MQCIYYVRMYTSKIGGYSYRTSVVTRGFRCRYMHDLNVNHRIMNDNIICYIRKYRIYIFIHRVCYYVRKKEGISKGVNKI